MAARSAITPATSAGWPPPGWRALGDEKLLARYARQRLGPVQAMAQVTDGLLQLFASEQPLLKELRNRGLSLADRLPPLKRLLTARALGS